MGLGLLRALLNGRAPIRRGMLLPSCATGGCADILLPALLNPALLLQITKYLVGTLSFPRGRGSREAAILGIDQLVKSGKLGWVHDGILVEDSTRSHPNRLLKRPNGLADPSRSNFGAFVSRCA